MYLADSSRLPTVHLLHDNVVYLGFTIIQSRISASYSDAQVVIIFYWRLSAISANREGDTEARPGQDEVRKFKCLFVQSDRPPPPPPRPPQYSQVSQD